MSQISCRNIKHDFKEIILLCLNRNCKQSMACTQCIQQFHINHIHDCFQLNEMEFILSNEVYKISKLTNIQHPKIQACIEEHSKLLNKALSIFQQIRPNQQQIQFIITITKQCYNKIIYYQLISFILQNLIDQSDEKSQEIIDAFNKAYSQNTMEYIYQRLVQQGNRLLELKQLKQAINYYKQAYQLNYNEENFIIKYCNCLKLNKNILEALKLMNNHRQIFNNDQFVSNLDLDFQNYLEQESEFRLYHSLEQPYSYNYFIECANILLNMNQYDLCHQYIDYVLKKDPQNETAVIIKVDALLKEHKFGLAKQFVDQGEQKYPKIYRIAKYMCLINDRNYFSSYKQSFHNLVDKNLPKTQLTDSTYYSSTKSNDQNNDLPQQSSVTFTQNSISTQIFQQQINLLKNKTQQTQNNKIPKFFQMLSEFQKKNYFKALDLLDQLLSVVPIYRILYALKSRVYFDLSNFGLNLKFAKIAMYLGKEISFYTRFYAFSLLSNGEVEKAIEILEKSNHKNDQKILMLRGKIYYEQSQYPSALKCFEQIQELQQNSNDTVRAIIKLIKKQNNIIQNSDDKKDIYQSCDKMDISQSYVESKNDSEISMKSSQFSEINATSYLKIGLEFDIGEILNMIPKEEIAMFYDI